MGLQQDSRSATSTVLLGLPSETAEIDKFRVENRKAIFFRESFCESGEGVRLPRERADLRGSPGNFRGSSGNFRGSLGNFRGTPGLL